MAVVRGSDPSACVRCLVTLAEEGITLAEVSLSGAGALDVIRRARLELGADALLGAGTVVTPDDARAALDAGASYLVSPGVTEGIRWAAASGEPVLPGALTPTEILAAHRLAGGPVKLFPASMGGPAYLEAVRAPFPDVPLVAVGGVGSSEAGLFLSAGAVAVGVGSPLIGDAAEGGSLRDLRNRARELLRAQSESAGAHR